MNPSSSSSNSVPATIPGYDYDPILNRFFKSSSSGNSHRTQNGNGSRSQTNYPQDGGPPSYTFRAPSVVDPKTPPFDPEIGPPSLLNQCRYRARLRYRAVCSASAQPTRLVDFNAAVPPMAGHISTMMFAPFELGKPQATLFLGTTQKQGLCCQLSNLFHYPESLGWDQVDLPCPNETSPINCVAHRPGLVCFGSASGCDLVTVLPCRQDVPHLFYDISLYLTTWCLSFTSQKLLIGTESKLVVYDIERGYVNDNTPKACILDIEKKDEFNSLLGTRSGFVMYHDVRANSPARKEKLNGMGSVRKLKLIDDNQILIIGAVNYAKVHDIRYLTSRPTRTLDDWHSLAGESFGFSLSQDKNLVCMAGRDQTLKIWDLQSNPNPGLGLRPIATHHTSQPVNSVLFIDSFPHGFWWPKNPPNGHIERTSKKPCGPGILFGQGNALHWLGPAEHQYS